MNYCYCKICKEASTIIQTIINADDNQILKLDCGHQRVFQLISSSKDYLRTKEE